MLVTSHNGYASLPPTAARLFADPGAGDLLRSHAWLQNAERNGLRPGDRLRIYSVQPAQDEPPLALFPATYSRLYPSHPQARVLHFTLPEDQDFVPLAPTGAALPGGVAAAVFDALHGGPPTHDVIRFSPLLSSAPLAAEVVAALRSTDHFVQVYRHPPARYEAVAGMSAQAYLAARPRSLRESLERNTRLLLEGGRGRFHFPCNRELLEATWGDVRRIVESTPVEGEPERPNYLGSMMALAASHGALRLGLFYLDGVPVAMQFWIVSAGIARCLRIWSAQDQRVFPIDDVLTQMMAVCLIDGDRAAVLDFGVIDEEFAGNWAPQSRERIGIAAFTRRTLRGLRGAVRHVGAQRAKSLPGRILQRLKGARRS